jgi:hypothetical protein
MRITHTINHATYTTEINIISANEVELTRLIDSVSSAKQRSQIETVLLKRDHPITVAEIARLSQIDDDMFVILSEDKSTF